MKKIFINILLATAAFALQSCLHDEQELFDEAPANRLDKAVATEKALLESATNGWLLQFYTGQEYSGSGYNFLLRFKNGKAYVSAEIAPSNLVSESKYDITQERGTVLTFPTFNTIMHHLARAFQNNVDGFQGDYEFVILRATQDSIYLRGKKWGNDMLMTRMPLDIQWQTYLDSIGTVKDNLFSNYRVVVNNTDIGNAELDADNGRIAFTGNNGSFEDDEKPFCFTLSGIAIPTPVDLKGEKVSVFTWDAANDALVSGNVKLVGVKPDSYQPITFWAGDWRITYNSIRTLPFTITPAGGTRFTGEFTLRGETYHVALKYNTGQGCLSLASQDIEDPSETYAKIWFGAADMQKGQVSFEDGAGMNIVWDEDTDEALFIDNGKGGTTSVNSFVLIGKDEQGNLVRNEEGYLSPIAILRNLSSMTK